MTARGLPRDGEDSWGHAWGVRGWTWDPPSVGQAMPDGRGRIEAVAIVADSHRPVWCAVDFRTFPGGVFHSMAEWPATNRRAKRLQRKARRRARAAARRTEGQR